MSDDTRRSDARGAAAPPDDVALVLGATEDGATVAALRKRGDEVRPAILRRAEEGQPIHDPLVRLKPREAPNLFDVETLYEPPAREPRPTAGPAQVASPKYRSGWGRVFGGRRRSLPS